MPLISITGKSSPGVFILALTWFSMTPWWAREGTDAAESHSIEESQPYGKSNVGGETKSCRTQVFSCQWECYFNGWEQLETKAGDTVYVILPLCGRNMLTFCSPILIPCPILHGPPPICPAVIQLFVFSCGCFLIQNYPPWSRASKVRVSFKPVMSLTKEVMVTGNSPLPYRLSPACQLFSTTASAIPSHRSHLATFWMLLWPCLHFHFQE